MSEPGVAVVSADRVSQETQYWSKMLTKYSLYQVLSEYAWFCLSDASCATKVMRFGVTTPLGELQLITSYIERSQAFTDTDGPS